MSGEKKSDQHCAACGWVAEIWAKPGEHPPCPACGGTTERIFMSGEETSNGRVFAHVVLTGESWELPALGKFAWKNSVASPHAQDKTIVMGPKMK